MAKQLIAFYSRNNENYLNGQIVSLKVGNTKVIADIIKEFTNADIYEIVQETPYSSLYDECVKQAKYDLDNNINVKISNNLMSIDDYDVIYLGFPNYYSTMPLAVVSFLKSFDFTNKTIKPFCTHEGGGFGYSLKTLKRLCPLANIKNGIAFYGSKVNLARNAIKDWLNR